MGKVKFGRLSTTPHPAQVWERHNMKHDTDTRAPFPDKPKVDTHAPRGEGRGGSGDPPPTPKGPGVPGRLRGNSGGEALPVAGELRGHP